MGRQLRIATCEVREIGIDVGFAAHDRLEGIERRVGLSRLMLAENASRDAMELEHPRPERMPPGEQHVDLLAFAAAYAPRQGMSFLDHAHRDADTHQRGSTRRLRKRASPSRKA